MKPQTRIEILAEVIYPKEEYPEVNKMCIKDIKEHPKQVIALSVALEAMKRFGELAFEASRERVYSKPDREVMAKFRTYNDWLTKIEEEQQ